MLVADSGEEHGLLLFAPQLEKQFMSAVRRRRARRDPKAADANSKAARKHSTRWNHSHLLALSSRNSDIDWRSESRSIGHLDPKWPHEVPERTPPASHRRSIPREENAIRYMSTPRNAAKVAAPNKRNGGAGVGPTTHHNQGGSTCDDERRNPQGSLDSPDRGHHFLLSDRTNLFRSPRGH